MHCECMIEGGVLNTLDIPHDYWHHLIVCYCDISLNAYLVPFGCRRQDVTGA